MYLAFVSLIAGAFTALAPCVLPILPIMLTGEAGPRDKYKSMRIIVSLCVSVFIFTILLKYSSILIDINLDYLKALSGIIIMLVAIFTYSPLLWTNLMQWSGTRNKIQELSGDIGKISENTKYADYVLGATLGPIFSSCSPTYFFILAAILPISLTLGLIYLIMYCAGLAIALYIISIFGSQILGYLNQNPKMQNITTKIIASLLFITGLVIVLGYDSYIEKSVPSNATIQRVENSLLSNSKAKTSEPVLLSPATSTNSKNISSSTDKINITKDMSINNPRPTLSSKISTLRGKTFAPELSGISGYINTTDNLTLADALSHNKVVIVYMWTFGCINCQRSLPSLNALYEKYHTQGLEVIGVHTPEFSYERKIENVKEAAIKLGVKFPVVLDNDYSTWRSYDNNYWPHKYIILPNGEILYDHSGEGAYDEIADIVTKIIQK